MLRDRQTTDSVGSSSGGAAKRINLLNWDGKGRPAGLFPPPPGTPDRDTPGGGDPAAETEPKP
jgi:nitrate reductase beta subunit